MSRSVPLGPLWRLAAMCLCLGWCTSAAAEDASSSQTNRADPELEVIGESEVELRFREGLQLEASVGEFRDAGGRIAFYPKNRKHALTVLENLALERVYGELENRRERRQWIVSGVVTEYRGGNYLQITQAVMKPKESASLEPGQQEATPSASSETTPTSGSIPGSRSISVSPSGEPRS